uniref:Galectin domain-containing protein n=1 Tax=Globodera rostochiensis TaxID=31243 RepID=A0A914HLA9_GLORO
MRLILILSIFFLLFTFINSQCSTKPIWLTAGEIKNSIEYNSLAQCSPCMKNPEHAKTFGLSFRLPTDGQCDDGLLICYPSTLHGIIGGDGPNIAAVKGQFKVGNKKYNNVTRDCAKHWKNDGKDSGSVWHGIFLYTKRVDGKRHTMMNMSISSKEYDFGLNRRQFSIHFGNQSKFLTYPTVGNEQHVSGIDDEFIGISFLEDVQKGAFLREYVGLWMLGLDMLAPSLQLNINLFIYRGCNCTMEAWFTQPTDSEAPIDREIAAGSVNCIKTINGTAQLGNIGKGESAVNIMGLTDKKADNIVVELLRSSADKDDKSLISFSLWGHKTPELTLDGKGSKQKFQILIHGYSFTIWINGKILGEQRYWPAGWWNGINGNVKVKLTGQMMLLEDPSLDKISDELDSIVLPFVKKLRKVVFNGTTFTFRVQLGDQKDFNILLLHDRPDFHEYIGATILQMKINSTKVVFEVFYYGKLQLNESASENYSFNAGQAYEFRIDIFDKEYQVKVNGESFKNYSNSMPIWTINFLRVQGNVTLLVEPEINFGAQQKAGFSKRLERVLNYGDNVRIFFKVPENAKKFQIYFMHESSEFNKMIGDVVLKLEFDLNSHKVLCSHYLHMESVFKPCKNTSYTTQKFKKGQSFTLQILAAADGYYGHVDEKSPQKFGQHFKPINQSVASKPIPPWAIDHIRFDGDAEVRAIDVIGATKQNSKNNIITWDRIQFTQINDTNGHLKVGERIFILFKLKMALGTHFNITINLFNEALQFHDLIGKTVMKVELCDNILQFNSYYNKHWMVPDPARNTSFTFTMNLAKSLTELKFEITAMDAGFGLSLEGKDEDVNGKKLFYPGNTPTWAVQYITVDYRNITLEEEPKVTCKPEERCK